MRAALGALVLVVLAAACTEVPESAAPAPQPDRVEAVIDLSDQAVTVTRRAGGRVETHVWPVSTGRAGYPTPTGRFHPTMLSPNHRSSLYDDAPMPWSVFFNGNIGIHGTYEIASLGRPVSHGCVRLHPDHARTFYAMVEAAGKSATLITVQP
ncbi:L,D-transpeptidase [Maritimibacter fusiformis]|uniref:L,D-transpeptidase n=1 Tax=Maritimibacter fusiformis TaxID=2603819 RepID=A0A5D0RPV2_9RHOB|nr:L,D-transpeptidase [Maritimibacter fusiformis]TYB83036.1 L,D-transpeptidase [Maritimibacter fusiformis]